MEGAVAADVHLDMQSGQELVRARVPSRVRACACAGAVPRSRRTPSRLALAAPARTPALVRLTHPHWCPHTTADHGISHTGATTPDPPRMRTGGRTRRALGARLAAPLLAARVGGCPRPLRCLPGQCAPHLSAGVRLLVAEQFVL
jgi:hypothetical protein